MTADGKAVMLKLPSTKSAGPPIGVQKQRFLSAVAKAGITMLKDKHIMKEFTIGQNDAGQRLDKFITKAVPLLPPSLLYKGIRTKRIKLNGKRAEIGSRLAVGDIVTMYLNDEFFEEKRQSGTDFLHAGNALCVVDTHIIQDGIDQKNIICFYY